MRTNLKVPYSEKDEAKRLGARWDPELRTWYVVDREDLYPFLRWMPEYLLRPTEPVARPSKKKKKKKAKFARPPAVPKPAKPRITYPNHDEPLYSGVEPPWDVEVDNIAEINKTAVAHLREVLRV